MTYDSVKYSFSNPSKGRPQLSANECHHDSAVSGREKSPEQLVDQALHMLREWIPSQGPIGVFVHHNTLHHFEHLTFEQAVEMVGRTVGAAPYLTHGEYLAAWQTGRISDEMVREVTALYVRESGDSPAPELGDGAHMLFQSLKIESPRHTKESLVWALQRGHLSPRSLVDGDGRGEGTRQNDRKKRHLQKTLDQKHLSECFDLYQIVYERLIAFFSDKNPVLSQYDTDPVVNFLAKGRESERINELTIALCAAYLDQGVAHWPMPRTSEGGLWSAVMQVLKANHRGMFGSFEWPPSLDVVELSASKGPSIVSIIAHLLQSLKVPREHWAEFIVRDHFAVSGWAGLVGMLEQNKELFPSDVRQVALADLVAIRLTLHLLVRGTASVEDKPPNPEPFSEIDPMVVPSLTYQILRFAQLEGLDARHFACLPPTAFQDLASWFLRFDDVRRRRLLHQAYEGSFQATFLRALLSQGRPSPLDPSERPTSRPLFQAAFCIDEREESFRRHLEELCPGSQTFGAAGFFGIAMAFRSAHEMRPVPLCPVVVQPRHLVVEDDSRLQRGYWAQGLKSLSKLAATYLHLKARSLVGGQVIHFLGGLLGGLELIVRTATPGVTRKLAHAATDHHLRYKREVVYQKKEVDHSLVSSLIGELTFGFTAEEMADRVAGLLKTIGLTRDFAKVVFLVGHGSTTNNNPFFSAYECGACGGRRGDRNGRVFALMANRADVRELLHQRGILIPEDTIFVGACHDTCADSIDFFDTESLPLSHRADFEKAKSIFDQARQRNAAERCRRFSHAHHLTPKAALAHVEARSFNMREPRPEYGHGSNAACVVGRRRLTRGLFLDRRSFLVSYDWTTDDSGKILESILGAVMPVCSGISLEYYFSRVDNRRYGAGTKLPHNVVGMVGVMDGLSSDLRTGLPWQTVEIHEPMRLFTVIEAPLARIRAALSALEAVHNLLRKRWIVIAYVDPLTGEAGWLRQDGRVLFTKKGEHVPEFEYSHDYYRGHMDHLPPVSITSSKLCGVSP